MRLKTRNERLEMRNQIIENRARGKAMLLPTTDN